MTPATSSLRDRHREDRAGRRIGTPQARFRYLLAAALCLPVVLCAQAPDAPKPQGSATQATLEGAKQLMDAGEFDQAAKVLKTYLQTNDGSASAHTMLAYSYLRLDDPSHSLEQYTRAAAIERPSAIDLQNVAKDYVLLNDLSSAEKWIGVSLQMNERDPESWYALGRIRYTQQHFQQAVECFNHTLALMPESVKAENNLGLSYEALNRTSDAIAAYRQAIAWQKDQKNPSEQPLLNLGIVLVHQGKLEEARSLLMQAVAIAPRDVKIREQLGHLYLNLNMLAEAQRELEEAIRLDPKRAALHFFLGKVYHQQGQEQKAKAEFALAASLSGEHSTPDNL